VDHSPIPPLIRILDEHLDASLDRLDKGLAPIWESQFQMGKTLITLASSALILSISVIQVFANKVTTPKGGWVLITAWVLFAVTVVTGAARQSWAGSARSLRIQLEGKRKDLRTKVGDLSLDDEDLGDKFDAILEEAFTGANALPEKAVKVHNALNQVMFWAFTLGLGGLLVFAVLNLPF
jgi:hypothetical protein